MANSDHKSTPASRGRAHRGLNTDRGWINEREASETSAPASEPLAREIEALMQKWREARSVHFENACRQRGQGFADMAGTSLRLAEMSQLFIADLAVLGRRARQPESR